MAEKKNTEFGRPGGYAMPRGATAVQREAAREIVEAADDTPIQLFGDGVPPHSPQTIRDLKPAFEASDPDTGVYVGDCRDILAALGRARSC